MAMTMTKVFFLIGLILIFIDDAQCGYCTESEAYTAYYYVSYQYLCSWGWGQYCHKYIRHSTTKYRNRYRCCSGYIGTSCRTPVCSPSCLYGTCGSHNKCDCPSDRSGTRCAKEICSAKRDCYPGRCKNSAYSLSPSCLCDAGFSGKNCETIISVPVFRDPCKVSLTLKEASQTRTHTHMECPENRSDPTVVYTKEQFSHVSFQVTISYEEIPITRRKPWFVTEFRIGVIQAGANIRIRDSDGKIKKSTAHNCATEVSTLNPIENIPCHVDVDFSHDFEHQQSLEIELTAQNGGMKRIQRDGRYVDEYFSGNDGRTTIKVKFDLQRPQHCTEISGGCLSEYPEIISLGSDITKNPNIDISFSGWFDNDSGLHSSKVLILSLSFANGYLIESQALITHALTFEELNKTYHAILPAPGRYSVIREIYDAVGNVAKARSTILYDQTSTIEVTENEIQVVDAVQVNGMFWMTQSKQNIQVSWEGRYRNAFISDNHLLAPLASFDGDLDDTTGNLSASEVPYANGISSFFYRYISKLDFTNGRSDGQAEHNQWVEITPPKEGIDIPLSSPLSSGEGNTVIIKVQDVLGNTLIEPVYIRRDDSPPVL